MRSDPPALDGVRHEQLSAGGLRVHVALAGPDDAPPVMLVHGWPQNWWVWRHVVPPLATRYRVIAPDLRGHGWTEAPGTGYDKEQLASDLLAVLDGLDVPRVTWVGHDWGGFCGFLAALRAPDRIERLLALCIPHLWVPPSLRRVAILLGYQLPISAPFVGPRVADRVVRAILQTGRGGERLSDEDLKLYAAHLPAAVTVAMYRTFVTREMLRIARGRYAQERLRVPTTLLVGERDLVTRGLEPGPQPGQPQLSVHTVPGVAHWLPEQRPQAVIDWVQSAPAA